MGVYEVERIVSGRYETQLWFWWYSVLTEMFRTLFNLNLVHMTQLLNNASLGENASYCPQKRGNNSLGTFLGVRREQLSRAFRTFRCSFRRWSFDNTCGHRINAKFHQSLVEISNLLHFKSFGKSATSLSSAEKILCLPHAPPIPWKEICATWKTRKS